jgi:hypothetical protein
LLDIMSSRLVYRVLQYGSNVEWMYSYVLLAVKLDVRMNSGERV